MIAVLAGGTGAAKFLRGLACVVPQERIAVIVNTGDDLNWWGVRVCPDLDTITYCLAGLLDEVKGWGIGGDSFACRDQIQRFGEPAWFNVGDRDLALHLYRTRLRDQGQSLTQITQRVAEHLGVRARILPMSDHPVQTIIHTPQGEVSFQEFFVRQRWGPHVSRVEFRSSAAAQPGPAVLQQLADAESIIVAPSNPITSIGPILSVPQIRSALCEATCPVVAISPIVGGAAVSGPAGKLMQAAGLEVSAIGVATAYRDWLDLLIADVKDEGLRNQLLTIGIDVHFTDTLMSDAPAAQRLASDVLRQLEATTSLDARPKGGKD